MKESRSETEETFLDTEVSHDSTFLVPFSSLERFRYHETLFLSDKESNLEIFHLTRSDSSSNPWLNPTVGLRNVEEPSKSHWILGRRLPTRHGNEAIHEWRSDPCLDGRWTLQEDARGCKIRTNYLPPSTLDLLGTRIVDPGSTDGGWKDGDPKRYNDRRKSRSERSGFDGIQIHRRIPFRTSGFHP